MKIIIKVILICFMSILSFTPVFAEETNLNTIPDDKTVIDGDENVINLFKETVEQSKEFKKVRNDVKGVYLERVAEDGDQMYITIAYKLSETDDNNIAIFVGNKNNDILYAAVESQDGTDIMIDTFSKSRVQCGFYICTSTKTEKIKGNFCSATLGKKCGSFPEFSKRKLIKYVSCKGGVILSCKIMAPTYTVCSQHIYKANICDM